MTRRSTHKSFDLTWSVGRTVEAIEKSLASYEAIWEHAGDEIAKGGGEALRTPKMKEAAPLIVAAGSLMAIHYALPHARVVMCPLDQLEAVDVGGHEMWSHVRPPFPVTYFDFADPKGGGGVELVVYNPEGHRFEAFLAGALVAEIGLSDKGCYTTHGKEENFHLAIMPVIEETKRLANGMHVTCPARVLVYRDGKGLNRNHGLTMCDIGFDPSVPTTNGTKAFAMPACFNDVQMKSQGTLAISLTAWVMKALMLMESVNVEPAPADLTPKQSRRVAAGERIRPYVIKVHRTTRRSVANGGVSGRKLKFQHEVRGHFKHHPPGTPVYDKAPEAKRLTHPFHGPCVRVWSPSHIRGPEDAPLIVRPRIIVD